MTVFDQNGTAENRNFGRIWKPKPKKAKKSNQKNGRKNDPKKKQKNVPLTARRPQKMKKV